MCQQKRVLKDGCSGIVYRSSLAPFYSTVFNWAHISLTVDVQNEIKAMAYLQTKALWKIRSFEWAVSYSDTPAIPLL